ncbi:uncharacterized protein G2W53_021249 [Senna tora]|uniref:Uncharacterized protein n=1 Tax=Senna tora TaxID=362788 RepID=A0A834TLJ0_9FABA|nr:uncharacterized protein G2W53_021249 [Senna tora]
MAEEEVIIMEENNKINTRKRRRARTIDLLIEHWATSRERPFPWITDIDMKVLVDMPTRSKELSKNQMGKIATIENMNKVAVSAL